MDSPPEGSPPRDPTGGSPPKDPPQGSPTRDAPEGGGGSGDRALLRRRRGRRWKGGPRRVLPDRRRRRRWRYRPPRVEQHFGRSRHLRRRCRHLRWRRKGFGSACHRIGSKRLRHRLERDLSPRAWLDFDPWGRLPQAILAPLGWVLWRRFLRRRLCNRERRQLRRRLPAAEHMGHLLRRRTLEQVDQLRWERRPEPQPTWRRGQVLWRRLETHWLCGLHRIGRHLGAEGNGGALRHSAPRRGARPAHKSQPWERRVGRRRPIPPVPPRVSPPQESPPRIPQRSPTRIPARDPAPSVGTDAITLMCNLICALTPFPLPAQGDPQGDPPMGFYCQGLEVC